MACENFNIPIVFRVIIILILGSGATLCFMYSMWVFLGLSVLLIIYTTYNLIKYFNGINDKLTFFFDSIRNDDTTLHFPVNTSNKSVNQLNRSLKNLNGIISDIKIKSERKERFFMELIKHSTTGLMAIDEKGYIEIINDASLKLLNTNILVHIDRLKQINKDFYETITSLEPNNSKTIRILVNDKLHFIWIKMVKLKFGEKKYRIYSIDDIRNELDEKEMETWQKLIRVLAHEIMNSIAPISSISETLLKIIQNNKKNSKEWNNMKHGVDVINEQSNGLIHFVDNYRKLTKIPKPVFKPIEPDKWLEKIYYLFNERVRKEKIYLEIINNYRGNTFLGDQKLLTQVVINILNNAADALTLTPDKKITVSVSGTEVSGIRVRFTDNGKGISKEELEQIFIPFYTTKENGSGIGLSLSRQIIKLHKGELTAHSVPGEETVFEIKI